MDIEITSNITAIMPGTVQPGLTRPSPEPRIKQDANGVPDQVAKSDDKISQDANSLSKQVKKEMGNINKQLQAMNYSIRFSIDDTLKDLVVKIVDKDTDKVIRQIPPEDVLKLRKHMQDMIGLLLEDKA